MIDTLPVHHISRVLSILSSDGVVGFPTGTVYGLGANALSKTALQNLSDIKERDPSKTYSLLLPENEIEKYIDPKQEELDALSSLTNSPLTLLIKASKPLSHLALDGFVGVRTADHPFTRSLAKELEFPITATSANKSGGQPALSVEEMRATFPDETFMAVDGGVLPQRQASTVAQFIDGTWKILRKGEVTITQLKKAEL